MFKPSRAGSYSCILLLVAAACGGAEDGWGGSVVLDEGVVRTTNPGVPLADSDEVSITELWSFAGPSEGDVWGLPRHLGVSRRHAFVVDNQADRIHVVDLNGQAAGSLGGPGQGPGEYSRPVAAVPTDQGTFIVDGGNRRIDVVDDALTVIHSFGTPTIMFSARPWGPASILVQGMEGDGLGWRSWDALGTSEVVELAPLRSEEADGADCYVIGVAGDHLLELHCERLELRVFDRSGNLRKDIRVDLPPVLASDDEVEERVRTLRETMGEARVPASFIDQQVEAIRNGSRAKSMFRKVSWSGSTGLIAIWSQNPEDYGSGPATLLLLDENGVHLASLEFDRSWYDFSLRDGVLYSLERDESTGLVSLVARRLELAQSLTDRAAAIMR